MCTKTVPGTMSAGGQLKGVVGTVLLRQQKQLGTVLALACLKCKRVLSVHFACFFPWIDNLAPRNHV